MGNVPAKITGKYQSYDINTPNQLTPSMPQTRRVEALRLMNWKRRLSSRRCRTKMILTNLTVKFFN